MGYEMERLGRGIDTIGVGLDFEMGRSPIGWHKSRLRSARIMSGYRVRVTGGRDMIESLISLTLSFQSYTHVT